MTPKEEMKYKRLPASPHRRKEENVKLSDIFIGQIVMMPRSEWRDPDLPVVGKVVDIAYEYEGSFAMGGCGVMVGREARVVPVVHFLGEEQPRTVDPSSIERYTE